MDLPFVCVKIAIEDGYRKFVEVFSKDMVIFYSDVILTREYPTN